MAEGTYQVIARRWRPQQFDEIVGQEHIVRTLKNAIETNRIGHAYLFVGPRGTGKTTTARIFAKALNCTDGPKVNPPSDDPICQAIVAGSCMDVIEIDAATNRSIEDAKTIREECQFAPTQCKFKIFIIDEVHQLTKEAFNTLLKTLEEPPPHIKFIFATTESDKVLPTITSRCQRFEFQPIPEEKIAGRLAEIVKADGVEADQDALTAIARLANGGMRDSQSILDQVISFCGKKITARDVLDIYGLASQEDIETLASAMAAGDFAKVVALADQLVTEGRDLLRTLQHTQARVREALLASIREGGKTDSLGASLATEQLLRMLETLQSGEAGVRGGLSERANFEVTLLKAVEQSRSRAIDTLIKEISTLAAGLPQEAGQKKIDRSHLIPEKKTVSEPVTPNPVLPAPSEKTGAVEVNETGKDSDSIDKKRKPSKSAKADHKDKTKSPAQPESTPVSPKTSSLDDGPPLDSLGGADDIEINSDGVEIPHESSDASLRPPVGADSPEFKKAVETLSPQLREILSEKFRAQFTVLRDIPEERYLKLQDGSKEGLRETPDLDEEISTD
ncbi:MAG: DNA polymerase III subunit gamma/tau [Puniceicoccales bacterium]|jgi:DNA polymerase-3 subunit gamma/tau|nr:DNA polymerase III subunit gamma/tau [Puniceicoccales bacterium]